MFNPWKGFREINVQPILANDKQGIPALSFWRPGPKPQTRIEKRRLDQLYFLEVDYLVIWVWLLEVMPL